MKDNPDASDALAKKYQLPFEVMDVEDKGERPFLICRYNRVGDKHRSPWTNDLYPKADGDGPQEDDELRNLELKVNHVWDAYKNLYYGPQAVGSVYLQDSDKEAFRGVFGIQKKCGAGSWNSIHFIHVDNPEEKTCSYRVESSVLMILEPSIAGTVDLSASLSKQTSKVCKIQKTMLEASHIENIGKLVEANEIDLRSNLERVHIPKLQEILDNIQKKKEKSYRPAVNPLMGMIMESDVLKKKLAKESKS